MFVLAIRTVDQENINTFITFSSDIFIKEIDTLAKSVSTNSSLHAKVMCTVAISKDELYNNNTRNTKVREPQKLEKNYKITASVSKSLLNNIAPILGRLSLNN